MVSAEEFFRTLCTEELKTQIQDNNGKYSHKLCMHSTPPVANALLRRIRESVNTDPKSERYHGVVRVSLFPGAFKTLSEELKKFV